MKYIKKHLVKTLKHDFTDKNLEYTYTNKERLHIYKTYYSFINYPSCVNFIECAIVAIKEAEIKIDEDELTSIIIIILKSFLNKKMISSISEIFVNSDEIFNYVVEQYRFHLIISKKYMSKKSIGVFCLYILDVLVKKDLIEEKIVNIRSKLVLKTIKYYAIKNIEYIKDIGEYMIFSYKDYELIDFEGEYYVTTGHFSKTFELFKKNFNSDKRFKLKNIDYILNKINIKLYVDSDYQASLRENLVISKILILEEINKNINKINELYEANNWTSKTTEEIARLQSINSKMLDLLIYDNFANYNFEDNPIYFPIFLDFRGRKYYYSKIGPTSSRILRLAFFYGWYDQDEFENEPTYSKNYSSIIDGFCDKYKYIKKKSYYDTYFWILVGIGKFYIDKNKYPIKVEDFLENGIKNYGLNKDDLDLDEKLEVLHYKKILDQITDVKVKKRTIIKDATASINQVLMKKLGPLDQDSMNYVNLGEKWEWYDTYSVCKDLFYDYIKGDPMFKKWTKEDLNRVLMRPLIKDSVMKIPYSAGNDLCWKNYIEIVENKKYKIKIDKDLKKLMYEFYKFIRKDMQEYYLYKKTSTSLINKISEDFEVLRKYVLESETGEADISYYKMKKSSIDKKYKLHGEQKRVTKLILTPSEALDKKTFDIAAGANTVHFLDADEIRIIESMLGYSVITIHDSYLIDFKNCSRLIRVKIDHYQKEIDKISKGYTIDNIFIIL